MSTILKALERLEKDKQGGAPAEGASELAVVRPGVAQEPRRRWLWIAGGIGALALTGALALWLRPLVDEPPVEPQGLQVGVRQLGSETSPVPPAVPPALEERVAVAAVEPAPAPAPSPASAVVPGPQAPSPSAGAEQNAPPATPAAPPEPALQAAAPAPVAPATPPEPAPLAAEEPLAEAHPTLSSVAPVEPAPAQETAPPPREPARADVPVAATSTPEPAPIVEPEPAPPPPAREALRPRPTAPKPRPTPAVARAPEPKVTVERTIWHPDAARRRAWVRLEGRASAELREGDSLGGIAVRRIEPSGVVFAVEGRELRRAVGALP